MGIHCTNFFFLSHAARHVRSQLPDQGSNPRPLHWKCEVLTTGPPGKSLTVLFFKFYLFIYLFIGCIGSFVALHGLLSSCSAWAPGHVGSVDVARGLCSCGTQALQLRHTSSVVVAHGLSCPVACGILFP